MADRADEDARAREIFGADTARCSTWILVAGARRRASARRDHPVSVRRARPPALRRPRKETRDE